MHYACNENYLLPLSHDDVGTGNKSLLARMPGEDWEKRANLRLLYGYMYALPGKKLMFMGDEFGQWSEWSYQRSLDWHLLNEPRHRGLQRWVRDLNTQYRAEPALHELDCRPDGFAWIEADSANERVLTFLRKGSHEADQTLVVCNFSAEIYRNLPRGGSPGRPLARDPQQRRHDLRRQGSRQHGQPDPCPDRLEPPAAVTQPDHPARWRS